MDMNDGFIKRFDIESTSYKIKEYSSVIFIFICLLGLGLYDSYIVTGSKEIYLSTRINDEVIDVKKVKSSLFILFKRRAVYQK